MQDSKGSKKKEAGGMSSSDLEAGLTAHTGLLATCANSCDGALINARAANEQLLCGSSSSSRRSDGGEINKLQIKEIHLVRRRQRRRRSTRGVKKRRVRRRRARRRREREERKQELSEEQDHKAGRRERQCLGVEAKEGDSRDEE